MSQLGNGIRQRLTLRAELQTLVTEFDEASAEALPPDEHLWHWTQRARNLHARIAASPSPGRNKLLQQVRDFRSYVWSVRAELRRYREQQQEIDILSSHASIWDETAAHLPEQRRHKLSAAIAEAWRQPESHLLTQPSHATLDQPTPDFDAEQDTTVDPESYFELAPCEVPAEEILPVSHAREKPATLHTAQRNPRGLSHPAGVHSIRLDPITAIVGRLARPGTFDRAREIALAWLREKKFTLPASTLDNFELEGPLPGYRAVAVGLPGVWAMQAETAEAQGRGRRWRVELVLVDANPTPAVSITLTAISTADQPKPNPSVPALVSKLIDDIGLLDIEAGEILSARPIFVEDPGSLQEMLRTLQSPSRRRPVIVISKYYKNGQPSTLLDPDALAHKLRGIATVYVLSRNMSWGLTHELSKRFAVAGACARLFRPAFTPDDAPTRHPRWTPPLLKEQGLNLAGLSSVFEREAALTSLRSLEQEDNIPAFEKIREIVLKRQLERALQRAAAAIAADASDSTRASALQAALDEETKLRTLFEDDNEFQRQELIRLRGERDELLKERDAWKAREFHLKGRIESLEEIQRRNAEGKVTPFFPNNWDDLESWCEANLQDLVVVTNKAVRAARSSDFEDIPFCYEVLQFLAETYVPCKRGDFGGSGGAHLESEKSRLGIDISPVGRAAQARSTKDAYSANYMSKKVSLDMHVKGSSHRNGLYGFRLYFHWLEDEQKVIVGSFPAHLPNDMT